MPRIIDIDLEVVGMSEDRPEAALDAVESELVLMVATDASRQLRSRISPQELIERGIVSAFSSEGDMVIYGNLAALELSRFQVRETPEGIEYQAEVGRTEQVPDAFKWIDKWWVRRGKSRLPIDKVEHDLKPRFWSDTDDMVSPEKVGAIYAESLEEVGLG